MEISCPKFKRLRQYVEYSRWSELPICLLSEIIHRIDFTDDCVRFGAVCVSWRIAFLEEKKNTHPFLLIPSPQDDNDEEKTNNKQTRSSYDLSDICNLHGNISYYKYCCNSSFGWLVTMQPEERSGHNDTVFHIQLHNPFLSDKYNIINLPLLDKVVKRDGDSCCKPLLYLHKAILSCDPLYVPKKSVVMAIMGRFSRLAFYRRGDKDWTPIEWENDDYKNFDDVIYHNKTKLFYAVLYETGAVFTIDLRQRGRMRITSKLTQVAPPPPLILDREFRERYLAETSSGPKQVACSKRYLVETSSGDLLQVIKVFIAEEDAKVIFEVFKLDTVVGDWIPINNMGDTVVFLGDNCLIARSVSHCPGCKPNSIYCMDYNDSFSQNANTERWSCAEETGIYKLFEDRTVQPHFSMESQIIFPSHIWFEPTMGR